MKKNPSLLIYLFITIASLTISFTFILGLGLSRITESLLYKSVDQTLYDRLDAIRDALNGFEQNVPKLERTKNRFISFIKSMISNDNSINDGTLIQIYDTKYGLIASNDNFVIPNFREISTNSVNTSVVDFEDSESSSYRILKSNSHTEKPVDLIVAIGQRNDIIDSALNQFSVSLLLSLLPFGLIFTGIMYFVSRWLTRPLQFFIAQINSVDFENLHKRIDNDSRLKEISVLTERFNLMLERLEEGVDEQKRFVADVAHQIKTPLAIMAGQIQTALSEGTVPSDIETVLEKNLDEIKEMDRLFTVLLNLTRIESQRSFDFSYFDLRGLLESVIEDFILVAESRSCLTEISVDQIPPFFGNKDLLRQALINLFDNCTKYSQGSLSPPYKTKFELGLGVDKSQVFFKTTNFGPVIPVGEIPHLGERFYRGKQTSIPGAGLGLSLVQRVAKLHRGSLEIRSDEVTGTEFILHLPLNADKKNIISL